MVAFLTFKHHENSPIMKIINFLREYSYPVLSMLGGKWLRTDTSLHYNREQTQKPSNNHYGSFLTFKHHENSPIMKIINFLREYSYPVLSLLGVKMAAYGHFIALQQRTNTETHYDSFFDF